MNYTDFEAWRDNGFSPVQVAILAQINGMNVSQTTNMLAEVFDMSFMEARRACSTAQQFESLESYMAHIQGT